MRHKGETASRTERRAQGARNALALVSAVLMAMLLVHVVLGGIYLNAPLQDQFAWVVWIAVGLIVAHVVLAVATTVLMWTDTVRPPSARKKGHQKLKWASGVVLAFAATLHILQVPLLDQEAPSPLFIATALVLLCCLVWHLWTGTKSLTRDLGIDKRWRLPLRVLTCAIAACCAFTLIVAGI